VTEDQIQQMNMENEIRSRSSSSAEVKVEKRSRTRQRARAPSSNLRPNDDVATDPMMEQIVRTATQTDRKKTPVERKKRARNSQRKSLRRTLKNGLTEEEKKAISVISM